jgi:hypothetical protein
MVEVEIKPKALLTSALDVGEWSASFSSHMLPSGCEAGRVVERSGSGCQDKNPCSCQESNPDLPASMQ